MVKEFLVYASIFLGLFLFLFYIIGYLKRKPIKKISEVSKLPIVTIIVPAWNEEKGIGMTIESLQKLKYPRNKLEILVVDDGSSDNTYKEALKYQNDIVKVFRKEQNGGKFTALNYGIERAKGEIIFSSDADKLNVSPNSLIDMVRPFEDENVMCVSPSMSVNDSKNILSRVQQVEYLLGVFLRHALASINSVSVTPGAFSAYRKTFFDKYGGFKRAHLTEDMEMSMRIQLNNYKIVNVPEAVVTTEAPNKFIPLLKQRRRWYVGQIKNSYDYRKMFSTSYGALGVIVLPLSLISVLLSLCLSFLVLFSSIRKVIKNIDLLCAIKFDVIGSLEISRFMIEKSIFILLSEPLFVFSVIFFMGTIAYLLYAKKFVKQSNNLWVGLLGFMIVYPVLFLVWWTDTLIHVLSSKKVKWR